MTTNCLLSKRWLSAITVTLTVAALTVVAGASPASAASGSVSPVADRSASGVTADALPTVQIDGVVWSQAVVGNTVYAGGSFANARPAGAAAGTSLTPRGNLLAYNLTTGALITSFAPTLNAQVKVVVASPDGSRVYVGGSFTTANGQNRYRLAAYSTSTGALISSFAPTLDATVNALTVTNSTVYAGGVFGTANGVSRTRLAAFSASTGALLGWAPTANDTVDALQLTPDGSRVIVAGSFTTLNGSAAVGSGAVDATSGTSLPWAVNQVVQDSGSEAAILSLSTDGTSIFATSYTYGSGGNFEGVYSANPSTGAINWLADCHGDSYGSYGGADQVYVVSHEHFCSNIGGFPDTNPRSRWQRSTAFTTQATGTVQHNSETGAGYGDFYGQPSPSLVNWFPNIDIGTYTHQDQGAWTVTGNRQYVVEGGEFLHVNGTAQQGLVRFAVPSIAPDLQGPQVSDSSTTPTVSAVNNGTANVTWQTNWDPDNENLTYTLYRDSTASPIYSVVGTSQFWNRPYLSYRDQSLSPGTTYTYWVRATDSSGNSVRSANATVTTPTNQPFPSTPSAAFTASCNAGHCAFDGTGSSDDGGAVTSYAWSFGDGSTGVGAQPAYTYGQTGSYSVKLTVTDNAGRTASTTKTVNVTVPAGTTGVVAQDAFGRTTNNGWGTADVGGPWTVANGQSLFSTGSGVGRMTLNAPGASPLATLANISQTDSVQTVDVSADQAASNNGHYLIVKSRVRGSSSYDLKLRFEPAGVVHLALSKVVNGTETIFKEVNVAGLTYTPGAALRVRFGTQTDGAATDLTGSVWKVGAAAPTTPQISQSDSQNQLQGVAGAVALQGYLSGNSTNAPVTLSVDNYGVTGS